LAHAYRVAGSAITEENGMKALIKKFVVEESGQDLIEYGLLIGLITAGAIGTIVLIGPKVAAYFTTLNTNLP
jgi:pilus assembly protein Flp/PilA